jgi:TatD DNase family protein
LGFYISFSGTVKFKKADSIRASAAIVPNDRLLIETDCPFLAPVPVRGKRNEPAFVQHVAHTLAEVRGMEIEQLAAQTTANAQTLFGLPD